MHRHPTASVHCCAWTAASFARVCLLSAWTICPRWKAKPIGVASCRPSRPLGTAMDPRAGLCHTRSSLGDDCRAGLHCGCPSVGAAVGPRAGLCCGSPFLGDDCDPGLLYFWSQAIGMDFILFLYLKYRNLCNFKESQNPRDLGKFGMNHFMSSRGLVGVVLLKHPVICY